MNVDARMLGLLTVFAFASGMAWGQGTAPCAACGVIQAIAPVSERTEWTPLGAVTPGSLGISGLSTSSGSSTQMSFGSGGPKGLVVLGAAGGAAYAQRPSEYQRQRWEVTVKMDDGATRVVNMRYEPLLVQPGDRVRIAGNNVELVSP
jgi:outer membrane lipoprotein SlyB